MSSPRSLVYDLPTRLFHWLFAGLFVTTFTIANVAEHSPAFPLHMLAGMLLGGLVILRLIWGLVGTRHARFGSFALSPRSLWAYFRGMFGGGGAKWAGHNPASSWSALLMIALAIGLATTGLLMVTGNGEAYEEVHEVLANSFLVVAVLHVAGVVLHALRYRDAFPRSMVDGRKQDVPEEERIGGARPLAGILMIAIVATAGGLLWNGYDSTRGTLTAFGTTLQLREDEQEESRQAAAGSNGLDEHGGNERDDD